MKKYRTIYADPPWEYRDKLDDTRKKPYQELSVEDIKALPIRDLVDSEAHLYLWATHSHLKEALEVIEAWGFE